MGKFFKFREIAMNKINRFSLVAFAAAIFALPVFSQDESSDDVEEIIVTGSKLSKTNFDSDVPILTITGEDVTNRMIATAGDAVAQLPNCLLYTSPSPRDGLLSRMPSSA